MKRLILGHFSGASESFDRSLNPVNPYAESVLISATMGSTSMARVIDGESHRCDSPSMIGFLGKIMENLNRKPWF